MSKKDGEAPRIQCFMCLAFRRETEMRPCQVEVKGHVTQECVICWRCEKKVARAPKVRLMVDRRTLIVSVKGAVTGRRSTARH